MSNSRSWKGPLAAMLMLAAPAHADDESAGVTPGPFRAEPGGSVTLASSRIVLDGDRVSVALGVTARSGATIRLDLPRFGWLGEAEPYPDRQFPEMAVEVDGRPAAVRNTVFAGFRGQDITAALRDAGLDPFAIAETPPFVSPSPVSAMPVRRRAFEGLVASGAVTKAPEGFLAGWTASRTVRVTPGAGRHVVTFRYAARPAFALTTVADAAIRWADYCITPTEAGRLAERRGVLVFREYSVPSGLDGIRPPKQILRVAKAADTATIVCDARGTALIDPAGDAPVRSGPDGVVHILRIGRPG